MAAKFGSYIKKIRTDKGLSLRKICDLVKNDKGKTISVSYLNDIEQGYRNPPGGSIVVQIAKALGEEKEMLLKLAGKPDPELEKAIRDPKMAMLFRKVLDEKKG